MAEATWIRQAQAGDRSAFAELFRLYQVKAFRTACLITRDRYLATIKVAGRPLLHYARRLPVRIWLLQPLSHS